MIEYLFEREQYFDLQVNKLGWLFRAGNYYYYEMRTIKMFLLKYKINFFQ